MPRAERHTRAAGRDVRLGSADLLHSSYRPVLFGNCAIFGGTGAGCLTGAGATLASRGLWFGTGGWGSEVDCWRCCACANAMCLMWIKLRFPPRGGEGANEYGRSNVAGHRRTSVGRSAVATRAANRERGTAERVRRKRRAAIYCGHAP
jgi:hypothetical protein